MIQLLLRKLHHDAQFRKYRIRSESSSDNANSNFIIYNLKSDSATTQLQPLMYAMFWAMLLNSFPWFPLIFQVLERVLEASGASRKHLESSEELLEGS